MAYATWLLDALRAEGVNVIPVDGWETRGRGPMGEIKGMMDHHTAGPKDAIGTPSLNLIIHGRPDLAGPLSQLYTATNGDVYLVAAGRCNHAGEGVWEGIVTGNLSFVGNEIENAGDGHDDWPREQYEAAVKTNAAVLRHIHAKAIMAVGHKEYARPRGRKIDPAFDMTAFRLDVERQLTGRPIVPPAAADAPKVPAQHPALAMLRKGDRGESVAQLQALLGMALAPGERGVFGPKTDAAVRSFQLAHHLTDDGKVGPLTWKAMGV